MKYKYLLKGVENKDGNPYFIKDFYPNEENERRRKEKQIFDSNEGASAENQVEMEMWRGRLYVEGEKYCEMLQPPDPQDMLELCWQNERNHEHRYYSERGTNTERRKHFPRIYCPNT